MSDERERQVRRFFPLVRQIARRVKRMLPGADFGDLIGDGSVGLIRAVDGYDAARGSSFTHYASCLIAGHMLNGIRRMDPVPERARREVRAAEQERFAIASARGHLPTPGELERTRPELAQARVTVARGQPLSLDAPLPMGQGPVANWSDDPARIVERAFEGVALREAIAELTTRQQTVLMQHYFGQSTLRAIAKTLGISPQRSSQLHGVALRRLRDSAYVRSTYG